VVSRRGQKGDRELFPHLVDKTAILAPFTVSHEVANINGKGYFLVVPDIPEKRIKERGIPFIVSKDGEREIVRIRKLDL
jgi:hypothetical protein